jgi:hypothetical protein
VAKHYAAISSTTRLGSSCPRECAVTARHGSQPRPSDTLTAYQLRRFPSLPPSTWWTPSLPSSLPTGKAPCAARRFSDQFGDVNGSWLVCTCDGTQLGSRAMQGNKAERHVVPATRRSHSSRPQLYCGVANRRGMHGIGGAEPTAFTPWMTLTS